MFYLRKIQSQIFYKTYQNLPKDRLLISQYWKINQKYCRLQYLSIVDFRNLSSSLNFFYYLLKLIQKWSSLATFILIHVKSYFKKFLFRPF